MLTEQDPRWTAVLARDASADGLFVYGVKTTGVYCRPSSASRLPRLENIEFFDTPAQAEAAGYRASRRAAGDQTQRAAHHAQLVADACRLIEQSVAPPSLATLAAQCGLSPYHFHRVFKAVTGLTPKGYATAHRSRKVRNGLKGQHSVTAALYDAGFNSSSRFYESADQLLGMTASDYKAGGAHNVIRFAVGQCSLGAILVARSNRGVCAILLGDDPDTLVRNLQDQFPKAELVGADSSFEQWVAQVVGFIEAPALGLDLPLDVRGTAFEQRVWQALRDIPVGSTASYAQIAERIGAPKSYRAVAQACGANRLAVAIPCHRVVRSDGELSGYRWGVARKQALLERERNNEG
ncbi:bifunctional DNA-binding transcriptional regulator/O6-methylguanine-DNA methyltransferase Ada [Pseudomonas sp. lyk4-R2A-8]|uniref:bifunctional DNA-binding transcriptional regulator/O6-methylguanine-DNA methyltransferase Ada n=1 Tax=Pseudomonas sp. lyk4-R2A-8 TaxID=3040316 RepID=UPI002554DE87|nr:bifunctional DNA-binding transcriptional regulator/O6-methylguanine-DNA methyltransferase Ada [Pseudomonas sp. lyk4-R2A-8]